MLHTRLEGRRGSAITGALAVALALANVYVCRELFVLEYTRQMGSIEAAFISLARYISQNWRDLTWFPLWYNGIPFQNSYPPLLHATVAAVSSIISISAARAYHVVTATLYCLGPVAVFFLAYRLSRSRAYAFFAGLAMTALSPSAFLIPEIRHDMGTVFGARRLETVVFYGEGPHLLGVTLLPLAILVLHVCFQRRDWRLAPLPAIAMTATAMSNWLAALALACAVLAWVLAVDDRRRAIGFAALSGLLAYALAAPWMPPSTVAVIQMNAKLIGADYTGIFRTLPLKLLVAAIGAAAVWFAVRKANMALRWSALFTLFMAAIVLPAAWWRVWLFPQPERYHVEMEIGIAILLPFVAQLLLSGTGPRARAIVACVAVIAAIYPLKHERRHARYFLSGIDVRNTVEYRMADWIGANLPKARVMVPGTISYWMNTWNDVPQVGGGFDQGRSNFQIAIEHYLVFSDDGVKPGKELETSLLWLKAFGVQAVAAGGPKSGEVYKPYRHASKFEPLQLLWREGDDAIWKVPSRSASFARVVALKDLPSRAPVNGIDTEPLEAYVKALDDPTAPLMSFDWTSRHSAVVNGTLRPDDTVSLQITYHPGWHASRNGSEIQLKKDAIGQMYMQPNCSGECRIELVYDGGTEMTLAKSASWLGALASCGLLAWAFSGWRPHRPAAA